MCKFHSETEAHMLTISDDRLGTIPGLSSCLDDFDNGGNNTTL